MTKPAAPRPADHRHRPRDRARDARDARRSGGHHAQHRPAPGDARDVADANPTPYGYTLSLLLFFVPILVIAFWLVPSEEVRLPKRAFWRTIAILAPIGFGLDFFFARRLFTFTNTGATPEIHAPALGMPVPHRGVYLLSVRLHHGPVAVYVWMDEFWLSAYNVPDYKLASRCTPRLVQFHPTSVILGLVLIASAVA